jgi:hypothetical protein
VRYCTTISQTNIWPKRNECGFLREKELFSLRALQAIRATDPPR